MELIILITIVIVIWFALRKTKPTKTTDPATMTASPQETETLKFNFLICDNDDEIPLNQWYRMKKWKRQNFLKMDTSWSNDWKRLSPSEESVKGLHISDRRDAFIRIASLPGFQISLQRETENPVDKNAIKVIGFATVDEETIKSHIGYLSKETAFLLKDVKDIDARPAILLLPEALDDYIDFKIKILVRSKRYLKNL